MSGARPPGDGDGFLSRWSRRKRVVAEGEAAAGPPAEAVAPAAAAGDMPQQVALSGETPPLTEAEQAEAARRELDEIIASLPKVEEISATTDITGFMDSRIPDMLRNAALRAAWSADPAIRDFLNDAREYALDYNTPGAAPGYGLLSESERAQAAEFVKTLFSGSPEPDKDDTFVEGTTGPESEISGEESQPAIGAAQQDAPPPEPVESVRRTGRTAILPEMTEIPSLSPESPAQAGVPGAQQNEADPAASLSGASSFRRRGGGAMPA